MDPYLSLARGQYSQYDVSSEVHRQEGHYGSVGQMQAAHAYDFGDQRQDMFLALEPHHRSAAMMAQAAPSMAGRGGLDYLPLNDQQGAVQMPPPQGYGPQAGNTLDVNSQILSQGIYTPFDQSQVLSQAELNRLYQGASDVQIQDRVLLHERVVDKQEQNISKVVSGKRQILTIERVVEVPQVIVKETERRVPKPEIIERIIEVPGKVEYRYGRDGAGGFGGGGAGSHAAQLRAAVEEAQRTGKTLQQVCQERFGSTEMLTQMQVYAAVEEAQRTGMPLDQMCLQKFGSLELLGQMQAVAMGGMGSGMGGDDDIAFDYGGYGARRGGGNMHLVGPGLAAAEAAIAAYRQGGDIDAMLGAPRGAEPGSEEYNNWLHQMEAAGQIEIREEIIEVPQIVTEERVVHVPGRKEIQERLIEVPKVEWVEKVEYDDYVEYREVPVDKIIEVPEIEYVIKEVDVPVPQKYIQEYTVEKYKEVPVTQVQEVERIEHVPVMVPDGWTPPNLASLGMGSGGAASMPSQSRDAYFSSQAGITQSMSSMAPVGTSMPAAGITQSMSSMAPVGTSMPAACVNQSMNSMTTPASAIPVYASSPGGSASTVISAAPPSGLMANFSQCTGSIAPGGFGQAGSSVVGSMALSPGFTALATGTMIGSSALPASSVQASQQAAASDLFDQIDKASQQAAASDLFDQIDKDRNGTISRAELEQALGSMRGQSMAVASAPQSQSLPMGTAYCGGGVATPPQSMPPAGVTMTGGSAVQVNPFSSLTAGAQLGSTAPGTIVNSGMLPVGSMQAGLNQSIGSMANFGAPSAQAGSVVGQPMGSVTNAYMSYDPSRVGATGSVMIGQAPAPPQSVPCASTYIQSAGGSMPPQSLPASAMASGVGQVNPFGSMPALRTSMVGQPAAGVNPFGSMPARVGASTAGDLFSQIDTDGSGTITRAELEQALGSMRGQSMTAPQTMVVS